MGACVSSVLAVVGGGGGSGSSGSQGRRILDETDGGEIDYHERFLEDHVIGEGEFGQVKLVIDVKEELLDEGNTSSDGNGNNIDKAAAPITSPVPKACKILRKGMTFKDNTIYSPIKPEVLKGEVDMLRLLAGHSYCLSLVAVYESRKTIYIVTEYCGGGAMMEYVAAQKDDLHTEDVSRIAYQLFSAVHHCYQHGIMHRDIKPENSYVAASRAREEEARIFAPR
jgi:serine/threonine protein kinase